MNRVRSILSSIALDKHQHLQQIRDDAEQKYSTQFIRLIQEVDHLIDSDLSSDSELDMFMLQKLNDHFIKLIQKLEDLFERCKKICKKYAPENVIDQLDSLERESRYSYAQTCKSIKVIDACVKFNTLFSLFEVRLNKLNKKLRSIGQSRRRKTIRVQSRLENYSTNISVSPTRTRSRVIHGSPVMNFYKNFKTFTSIMKSEI